MGRALRASGKAEAVMIDQPRDHIHSVNTPPEPDAVGKDAATFIKSYVPLRYIVDGMLPGGSLCGLTGRTGHGKTAFATMMSLAIATSNSEILGRKVRQGRVAYICMENPEDFKMKLAANCYLHAIRLDELAPFMTIFDDQHSPESLEKGMKKDAEDNGPFKIIFYDTLQAGFALSGGADFNNNAEVLKFVMRLRPLTELRTRPSVIVLMHPTKNATEDDLVPYGGGAILNELDANLTIWATSQSQIKLHWNKARGPQFEPCHYRIEKLSCPDIVDDLRRQILLPVMRPSTEMDAEERSAQDSNSQLALLKAIIENPKGSQREWAAKIGKSQGSLQSMLKKLAKLVSENFGRWKPTKKGLDAAEDDLFG
jgi:hypothetical protein